MSTRTTGSAGPLSFFLVLSYSSSIYCDRTYEHQVNECVWNWYMYLDYRRVFVVGPATVRIKNVSEKDQ